MEINNNEIFYQFCFEDVTLISQGEHVVLRPKPLLAAIQRALAYFLFDQMDFSMIA